MYHNFFIHSSVDGHPGCFHVLAIVDSAQMNNEIHVSFSILVSSGYMPRSGIAGSYGGSIPSCCFFFISMLILFFFNFIFKLYNIVLVLPNIEMNLPQVYMCSPS